MLYKLPTIINDETVQHVINAVNDLQPFEDFEVYVRGDGGEVAAAEAIVDILTNIGLTNNVTLTAYEVINSSHFLIFFNTVCVNKKVLASTKGMIHRPSWIVEIMDGGKLVNDEYIQHKQAVMEQSDTITDLHKIVKFNKDELKSLRSNKDLWFTPARIKEFLDYNKSKTLKKPIQIKFENEDN